MARNNTQSTLLSRLPGFRRTSAIDDALRQGGVRRNKTGNRIIKTRSFVADVIEDFDDFVTVHTVIEAPADQQAALQAGNRLPGNARFMLTDHRWSVAADTRVDGVEHLAGSMQEIRCAFHQAITGRKSPAQSKHGSDPESAVRCALESHDWSDEPIIETRDGWEFQTRVPGTAVSVELQCHQDGVQLSRRVLPSLHASEQSIPAIVHQSMLFNGRFRMARLAIQNDELIVEARLRSQLINWRWLRIATQAVAAAAHGVTPTLQELAGQSSVSKHYTELLLRANQPSANPSSEACYESVNVLPNT